MEKTMVEYIESYIKIGNGDYQWSDNHGELIRCKDCKHRLECDYWIENGDDLFCADGERKCESD